MAPPQADSLLYQQYARAIAEGHPYRFNETDPPSTGSTSHLYPVVLAGFYWIGLQDDLLTLGAWGVNAVCYLIFLLCFWEAARTIAGKAAPLAMALCLASGQTVFAFMSQSDMGLFMAAAYASLSAAVKRRYALCGIALALSCFIRPEGLLLSGFLVAFALRYRVLGDRTGWKYAGAGFAGLAAWGGVLALNWALTGETRFHSVLGKDLGMDFADYVHRGLRDGLVVVVEALGGVDAGERKFYLIPIVGLTLAVYGLIRSTRFEENRIPRVWWVSWVAVGVGLAAMSGWQGVQHDRYLTWFLPVLFVYSAYGVRGAAKYLRSKRVYYIAGAVFVAYGIVGYVHFARTYHGECAFLKPSVVQAREIGKTLAPDARVGMGGLAGLAYYMPKVHVTNVNGITSPAFAQDYFVLGAAEILKHRPEERFAFWVLPEQDARARWFAPFVGEPQSPPAGGGHRLQLFASNWTLIDYPNPPRRTAAQEAAAGLTLKANLDVGYYEDEQRLDYRVTDRYGPEVLLPSLAVGRAGGRVIGDVGRLVLSHEGFQVLELDAKPLRVVMRSAPAGSVYVSSVDKGLQQKTYEIGLPSKVAVTVNGQAVTEFTIPKPDDAGEFIEVAFDVPVRWNAGANVAIALKGTYFSFGYWCYQ